MAKNKRIKQIKVQDAIYDIDVAFKDAKPTSGSTNVITSGGVFDAIAEIISEDAAGQQCLKLGSAKLTEQQLVKLINLLDSIE